MSHDDEPLRQVKMWDSSLLPPQYAPRSSGICAFGRAIVTELGKLGAEVEEGRDYCVIKPPKAIKSGVAIDTYDDHRMVSGTEMVVKDVCLEQPHQIYPHN